LGEQLKDLVRDRSAGRRGKGEIHFEKRPQIPVLWSNASRAGTQKAVRIKEGAGP